MHAHLPHWMSERGQGVMARSRTTNTAVGCISLGTVELLPAGERVVTGRGICVITS